MGSCCYSDRSHLPSQTKALPQGFSLGSARALASADPLKSLPVDFEASYKVMTRLKETQLEAVSVIEHKVSKKQRILRRVRKSGKSESDRNFRQGVKVLQTLDHPNVTKLYEAYEDAQNFYMLHERVEGGSVLDFLSYSKEYTEQTISTIIYQVLTALAYCHANNILHKNLQIKSLLLIKTKRGIQVKLLGFESQGRFSTATKVSITRAFEPYAAPEHFQQVYTDKGDIWSCGVILHLLLTGKVPFEARKSQLTQELFFPRETWRDISSEAKGMTAVMLTKDYANRPTARECLAMPWIANNATTASVDIAGVSLERLYKFNGNMKVQRTIFANVAKYLQVTRDGGAREEVFRSLDADNDGRLSEQELIAGYTQITGSESAARTMVNSIMQQVDFDSTGFIDFSEFLFATSQPEHLLSVDNLRELFHSLDHDHLGSISIPDLEFSFGLTDPSTLASWRSLLQETDISPHATLSIDQFAKLMRKVFNLHSNS